MKFILPLTLSVACLVNGTKLQAPQSAPTLHSLVQEESTPSKFSLEYLLQDPEGGDGDGGDGDQPKEKKDRPRHGMVADALIGALFEMDRLEQDHLTPGNLRGVLHTVLNRWAQKRINKFLDKNVDGAFEHLDKDADGKLSKREVIDEFFR